MTTKSYLVHGLQVDISAEASVLAAIHARLGQFPAGAAKDLPQLRFEFRRLKTAGDSPVTRPAGEGRSVLDIGRGEVAYFPEADQLYMDLEDGLRVLCDFHTNHALITYEEAGDASDWVLSHVCLTIPLSELLKRHGFYMLHAAGLAVDGKGLLVTGQSGSGKTTLTLALVRGGLGFMADDTVFLSRPVPGGNLRALAFPDEVDVTPHTASFFPEIGQRLGQTKTSTRGKNAVSATNVYAATPCWRCAPAVLVFPKPSGAQASKVSLKPKSEALLELLCNVLRTEPRASQAHLDALATLVRDCRCYRLETGRDFEALPGLMRELLAES